MRNLQSPDFDFDRKSVQWPMYLVRRSSMISNCSMASFNLPGEPPVVRPRDAVRTFSCSGTDAVFIDNFLLTKWNSAYILNGRSVQKQGVQGTV